MIRQVLTRLGTATASPVAFVVVVVYLVIWITVSPHTFDFHALATMAVWFMTLFIQRAEHRDTQALHAKLDELIRVSSVSNTLTKIDDEEPEDIEKLRSDARISD